MPITALAPVRQTRQRSREEVLAVLGDDALAPPGGKKALVRALLEFAPSSFLIDALKPVPACRRFFLACLPARVKYRGVYPSFAEARRHAPRNIPLGHDHDEIALGHKNQQFLVSDYPAIFWLRQALADSPTVLDFGGSVGISFYNWQHCFSYPENLSWTVCEVPAVARAGEKIAAQRNEGRLRFISQVEDAEICDCLLASGSLQYMEETLPDIVGRLPRLPRHLIINRIPLHSRRDCITLQNLRWAISPYRVFQRDAFISAVESLEYILVDAWSVTDHDCWIPFYPEFSVAAYSGLYFCRGKDGDGSRRTKENKKSKEDDQNKEAFMGKDY